MKMYKLRDIVQDYAYNLKESAAYSGSWGDGGSKSLLESFRMFKDGLVREYDLRPSEYNKLDDIDVGEPRQFIDAIDDYKRKLMSEMKL